MPTIAVFGAGPALGLSVARRFGRAGHDVALVARDPAKLDHLALELRAGGVASRTFTADLSDVVQLRAASSAVVERFGVPDVVLYSPGANRLPVGAIDLDDEELAGWLPLNLLSPVALVRALLPGMVDRGSGVLLFAQGASAREPMPALASIGVAQAALLHYLRSLDVQVRPLGVYVGSLLVGGLIERSAAAVLLDAGHVDGVEFGTLPRLDPDELAERLWIMARDQTAVELIAP